MINQRVDNAVFRLLNGSQQFPAGVLDFLVKAPDFLTGVLDFLAKVVDFLLRVFQLGLEVVHFAVELHQPVQTAGGRHQGDDQEGQNRRSGDDSLRVACDHRLLQRRFPLTS